MFKNNSAKRNPDATDTLVGEGTTFEGKIKSEASVRIEGHVIGDIECAGSVTIGERGSARSNVSARDLILAGKLTGDVSVEGTLTIHPTGELNGNLSAGSLLIEAGGIFNGTSTMAVKPSPGAASA
ncbi:bactofilin family protein [Paenibacillus arenilitoris]|uniref:Polymer-forming cytoskeletal protein n=1 Tax=Paenibacillus arenilitoris TaxID=2772299 RepID=A0A927CLP2_9BACL|nr:polymer-forming cytoskeletal protein [Paenibacillus arenilitoris]MBD2868883.1 polymer-forming cytoskeletal protein [Paenibacillus arenilitoris]